MPYLKFRTRHRMWCRMKMRLFHKIGDGGAESALVRQFIVDNGLEELIDFSNVFYQDEQTALFELAGPTAEAPVMLVDGRAIYGSTAIIDWLKTGVLCFRD